MDSDSACHDSRMTSEPLTEPELDGIARRGAAASPAAWTAFAGPGIGGPGFNRVSANDSEPDMYVDRDGTPAATADLEFIASARQDVPRLLAEVRRLRAIQPRS